MIRCPVSRRVTRCVLTLGLSLGFFMFLQTRVLGLIDANFTPVDLVRDADTILAGVVGAAANDDFKVEGVRALKGEAGAALTLTLKDCKKDDVEECRKVLTHAAKGPVIVFSGTFKDGKLAYLHVEGTWFSVKSDKKDVWDIEGFNSKLAGTFAGGTDMLTRMSSHLLANPGAIVPVSVGMRWMDNTKIAKVEGKVAGMAPVDLQGDNILHLFVACANGDKLFRPKKGEEAFEDVTAKAKLDSKSLQYAWIDINRDGLMDLVSWDGKELAVRLAKDGALVPEPAATYKLEDCFRLAPASLDGSPGMIVSGASLPYLLQWDGKAWKKTDLPGGKAVEEAGGQASACIVADLNNDGFLDVLQPHDSEGVLWRGKAGGFAEPVKSAVCTGGGTARFTVADFSEDGFLDIFLSGEQKNGLWENNGKAEFREVTGNAGSLSYKTPADASECVAADLNHDGRADLCMLYASKDFTYHFNRGFRCLGEEGELKLTGLGGAPGEAIVGQQACAIADFNADGSEDFAVVLTNGDLHCFYNDAFDLTGVNVRLKKGVTGPVTVSVIQGDKDVVRFGTQSVTGHAPGAFYAVSSPGECIVSWNEPGKPGQTVKVNVEKGSAVVILGEAPVAPKPGDAKKK